MLRISISFIYVASLLTLISLGASADTINVPDEYPTIQEAINNAQSGDTVLVAAGVYTENINFSGKDIVVGSLYMTTRNIDLISQTIIDADSGSVVSIVNEEGPAAQLIGFTITGGTGTVINQEFFGGGIFIKNASPVIQDNIIKENVMLMGCANRGGGLAITDSSNPLIIRNTITQNAIIGLCDIINYFGGGIWIDATSQPRIGDSEEDANNIFENQSDRGFQLYREGSGAVIEAQFNFFGKCPPDPLDVFPSQEFDTSNCLDNPVRVGNKPENRYPGNDVELEQNYPNPFTQSTTIDYSIQHASFVQLKIYNESGRLVRTLVERELPAGSYTIIWDGKNEIGVLVSSGFYFYKLTDTRNNVQISKGMLIIR